MTGSEPTLRERVEAAHPEPRFLDSSHGEDYLWRGIKAGREHVYAAVAALPPAAPETWTCPTCHTPMPADANGKTT